LHPVTSSYFQKLNWSWKDAGLIPLSRSGPNRRVCLTLWQKRTSRKRSKNRGDGGIRVYIREGTTSRVMAAYRPCGEFYDFTVSIRSILDTTTYALYFNRRLLGRYGFSVVIP
jgi:1-acyl-sn-glycerol-3-phosphate acyltransferase